MKEKIIKFVTNNWRYIVVAAVAITATAFIIGCGSTWRISNNNVTIEVMKRDTTMHLKKGTKIIKNETTQADEIRKVPTQK